VTPMAATPEPCGPDNLGVCDWVYEQTDSESAAKAADWLVGKPLAILATFAVALVARTFARWAIDRGVRRIMRPPVVVTKSIEALGGATASEAATEEIEQARKSSRAESISAALSGVVAMIIWTTAVVTSASILGFELGPLLAGAGVIGVAVGFGAQSLVRDCITGLFMLIEDQYGIGDSVDVGAATGTVERVSLRTTVLRGIDGTVWHVPNGEIRRVGNQSQLWSVAVVDVEVPRSADLDSVRRLMEQGARAVAEDPTWADDVLEAPRVLGVESVKAEVVTVRLVVKTTPGRQWALQRALREEIKRVLDVGGVTHSSADSA
jgi:small-conductance mechanosensitive channel